MTRTWGWIAISALACAACKNSNYCAGNPDDDCRATADAATDTPDAFACTSSTQCMAPNAVCDTTSGACVQCLAPDEAAACTGATPVCDANHTCRACKQHAECASDVCLPDGTCGDASQVAYVSATGTGTTCSQAAPCPLLADAVGKNLPYIKVASAGAAHATTTTVIDGKAVTILADTGAVIDRDNDGPIIEVRSANADVRMYDVTLSGATSASGAGVLVTPNGGSPKLALTRVTVTNNQGGGIVATGGAVTVSQSTIASNQGGGISISGTGATFAITNTYIYRNGDPDVGTYGGVNIGIATAGSNVFEFNTVVDNRASTGGTHAGGVVCDISGFTAPNNIVARNTVGGSASAGNAQTLGLCMYPTSKVQNDTTGLAFAAPDVSPYSYGLLTGSTAIDQATTASSITVDHDGDPRPTGVAKDIGADEYVP